MLLGIIFLNTEQNKSTFLRDEMFLIHYSLQIKQIIYSICIFRVPVVAQFIVKVYRKNTYSSIFKVNHFSINKNFLNVKSVSAQYILIKNKLATNR